MKTEYKYIYFDRDVREEKELKRKTQIWITWNNGDELLGRIEWNRSWRQYSFYPSDNTYFSKSCLLDIVDFIQQLMDGRKKK